jgi:hypothetical protein
MRQLVIKKLMMKLQARHPPQKKGVALMEITPASAREGIITIPNSKAKPINFDTTGCFPKRYLQMEKRLFCAAKPRDAPKKAPKNSVTDITSLLELDSS